MEAKEHEAGKDEIEGKDEDLAVGAGGGGVDELGPEEGDDEEGEGDEVGAEGAVLRVAVVLWNVWKRSGRVGDGLHTTWRWGIQPGESLCL